MATFLGIEEGRCVGRWVGRREAGEAVGGGEEVADGGGFGRGVWRGWLVAQQLCFDGSFTKARHSREGGNLAVGSGFRLPPE